MALRSLKCLMILLLPGLVLCTNKRPPPTDPIETKSSSNRIVTLHISGIEEKPWSSNSSFDLQIHFNSLVFSQLLKIGDGLKIAPGIITKWRWDESKREYILNFDDSRTYHDGSTVRAEDIEYALLRRYLRSFQDGDHLHDSGIVGIQKLKRGAQFKSGMCEGIKIIDSNTLVIRLKQRSPLFLYSLTESSLLVAPVHQFNRDHEFKKDILPIGTGPFRVSSSDHKSSRVRLERVTKSDDDGMVMQIDLHSEGAESATESDIVIGAPTKLLKPADFNFIESSFPISILVMDFNYSNPISKSSEFRSAVSLALKREKIAKEFRGAKPLHELIPPGFYGRNESKFPTNAEASKKVLKSNFGDLSKRTFYGAFHGVEGSEKPDFISNIEKQLLKVGLRFQFEAKKNVDFSNLDKKYIVSVYGFATSFVDPLFAFKQYIQGPESMRYNTVQTDEVAKDLLSGAQRAGDKNEKVKIIKTLSRHFQKENRTLPLLSIPLVLAYRKGTVAPLTPSKSFIFDLSFVQSCK